MARSRRNFLVIRLVAVTALVAVFGIALYGESRRAPAEPAPVGACELP